MSTQRWMLSVFLVLALLALSASAPTPAHAGGVVAVCDETHLLAALAGGGTVTFACSGTITLTATIVISAETTIDGSGHAATISGNDAVRVFDVPSGIALHLAELTVANGNASLGAGIFVDSDATLSASNVTFADNTASGWGGGVYGGAVHNRGTLAVTGSTFSGNSAGDGGGIYNAGGTVHISDSAFTGNSTRWYFGGGGILNHWGSMTVATSTFSGNSSFYGAGILNGDGGWLTVNNCLITGNNADSSGGAGGGIANRNMLTVNNSTFSGNTAWDGGGLRNYAGMVTINSSTFVSNSAGQVGGGIMNHTSQPGLTMTIGNSTFSGNSASAGGGVFNAGGNIVISNSTFSGNSAGAGGGVFNATDYYMATLKNTIVANSPLGENCSGVIDDGGGNLSYPDTSCPGANADPVLGPLQDNGGPSQTMALGAGSGAIDAGNDATCAAPPINNLDQRGVTRPRGPHCDIGAVEQITEPTAVSLSALNAQSPPGTLAPALIAGILLVALAGGSIRRRPTT